MNARKFVLDETQITERWETEDWKYVATVTWIESKTGAVEVYEWSLFSHVRGKLDDGYAHDKDGALEAAQRALVRSLEASNG